MSKKESALKGVSHRLSVSILGGMLLTLVIVWILLFAVFFLAQIVAAIIPWRYDSLFYQTVVLTLSNYRNELFLFLLIVVTLTIVFFRWKKTIGYLQQVADATEDIYHQKNSPILLPDELKAIETRLNEIKWTAAEKERSAREAEQRKNDLVVYLAHDLKTPLTSTIGYLTLLRDEQAISPELQKKYLSVALSKAQRLEELINELFDITRFNLTTLSLEPSAIDLTRMLEQLLFEFAPLMAEKSLKHELLAPRRVSIIADADKIQRAFDNILRNAVSYSSPNSTVSITLTEMESTVAVAFANSGATIPRDKLERVFEQFYRLDAARTSRLGGTGLGLAITKQIILAHGGSITASSAANQTVFTMTLPKAP